MVLEVPNKDSLDRNRDLDRLEQHLSYAFEDKTLLILALTHRSFVNEETSQHEDNERLEWLGDAVLDLIITDALFQHYPNLNEGKLSRMRAELVSEVGLHSLIKDWNLGQWLLLGKGEIKTGGINKISLLSNAFEALIGALYLDAGFERSKAIVTKLFEPLFNTIDLVNSDYKTQLQEYTQSEFNAVPIYKLIHTQGDEHEKTFEIAVVLDDKTIGCGQGKTKKQASQRAAQAALDFYQQEH